MAINGVAFDGEWNAESLTGADGAAITSWADDSGNGHTMAPLGAANPVLKTGVVNGKQVARFAATTVQGLKAAYTATNTASCTFVLIAKYADVSSTADGGIFLSTIASYPGGWSLGCINWASTEWGFLNNAAYNVQSPTAPDTAWHVWIGNWDGTNSTIWLDGVQIAQAALAPPNMADPGTTPTIIMGGYSNDGSTLGSNLRGDIAFAGRADRVLTVAEMNDVDSYANTTYGITVTPREPPAPVNRYITLTDNMSVRDTDLPLTVDTSASLSESIGLSDPLTRVTTTHSEQYVIELRDGIGATDTAGGSPAKYALTPADRLGLSDSVQVERSAVPLPTCEVRCHWVDAGGYGLRGVVQFVPEVPFAGYDGAIVEAPLAVLLGRDGSVIVLLPKPENPSLYPNGINWRCIPPSPVSPIAFTIDKSDNLITLSK